ncbi:recombination protein RecR [Arenimonas sp.]|nr:recombination protein RecR [Candidatus Parcubacteria bacterium]
MEELTELFKKFPGIGPRQAKRFVSFLMHTNNSYRQELITGITHVNDKVVTCIDCNRKFINYKNTDKCSVCIKTRDNKNLLILAYDNDIEIFERTMAYNGQYFILGKYIPLFSEKAHEYIDFDKLYKRIENLNTKGLEEIILALNATSDGDYTIKILKENLMRKFPSSKISLLGRGISTGSEIEYADQETLREALKFRR